MNRKLLLGFIISLAIIIIILIVLVVLAKQSLKESSLDDNLDDDLEDANSSFVDDLEQLSNEPELLDLNNQELG
jgi:uncharacterized membrane protein YvbJ